MSVALILQEPIKIDKEIFTREQRDIANSTSALFMFDVTKLAKGKTIRFTLQCHDKASAKWFDFAIVPAISEVGQYIYPSLKDSEFYQAIPSTFRVKCTPSGITEFSIGFDAAS